MPINKLLFTLLFCLVSSLGYTQVVTNATALNNAINAAGPGATITLADGIWKDVFIDIDKNGTASAPITVTAQNPGAVLMTGNSRVYMEGNYIIVSGLVFQDAENLVASSSEIEPVFELKRCNNCKVLNNKIDSYNGTEAQKELKFKWILTDGQHNEIAYNSFIGKYGIGSIINDNRNSTEPDYLQIHHNYFAGRRPINGVNDDNDQDAIRIGNSSTSLHDSFTEVYANYFYDFSGEVEIISNKSGQNKYYHNTFRDYSGTLTLRHGNNCEVYGNYFLAGNQIFSGGIRVIGEGHKIYNNYIEDINYRKPSGAGSSTTGGINVSNGRPNSELSGYYQVKNTEIVNNTFVNCDYALRIGTQVKSDLSLAPENLTVANNIMFNTSIDAYQITTEPIGNSISESNLTNIPASDVADDGNFHRLTDGSSPIDAGEGDYEFLTQDILGGNRGASYDAGAEEFGANGINLPYRTEDVGITVGFGASSNPSLLTSDAPITFDVNGGTATFQVIANVDWEITTDLPWLSFDITSGSGSKTITATAVENTTGGERTGTITINEVAGGNGLFAELSTVQLNTFLPLEIPIVATSSVGMQDQDNIAEENAYNDDVSNYWTGNPDTDPEVSITFDLGCSHTLTDIGINFWKADERTTTFSIAVSNTVDGLYTTVLDTEMSADANVTVNTEQLFSLNAKIGRYVKFIGIGNSSSTNWTSIANVNIYGNIACASTTSVFDNQPVDQSITVFPVPTNGQLNISSTDKPLNRMEVFTITGQQVLTADGKGSYSKQLDVAQLDAGTYFVKLEGIGHTKFIVK